MTFPQKALWLQNQSWSFREKFWGMLVWWLVSLEESQPPIPTHQIISFPKTLPCFYGALELWKHSPIHVLVLILQISPETRMLTPILEGRQ